MSLMRGFALSLALFAGQAVCAGGGGGEAGVLTKVLDFSDPAVAPIRIDKTVALIDSSMSTNTKPNDNSLDMRVWIKANDANRAAQEFHG